MLFKFKIGVDISKDWFDYCLMNNQFKVISKGRIINTPESIKEFIVLLLKESHFESIDHVLLVMEHTGLYINHLVNGWLAQGGKLSLVPANKISQALEATNSFEEKTDEMDARRIAEYAVRFEDKIELYQLKSENLKNIQLLRSQRKRAIKCLGILEVPSNENALFESELSAQLITLGQEDAIKALKKLVKSIDKKIQAIIKNDPKLKSLFALISSVHGVGPVIAYEILLTTNAFIDFLPNKAKSYAKYCGLVPQEKSSGKFKRKRRTTKKANTRMKSLLTTGALSLINTKSDLGRYYDRKMAEGKEHMSVINAMRNKLVLRVFAVVRKQTIYERNYDIPLDKP